MEQIAFATIEDISEIKALMDGAVSASAQKDWYVVDDTDFIQRHIGGEKNLEASFQCKEALEPEGISKEVSGAGSVSETVEGYTLKYVRNGCLWAFLIVRHPGAAEDNLGYCLSEKELEQAALEVFSLEHENHEKMSHQALHLIAHMESAAVHPACRGMGLQGKLLRRAEEIERSCGTKFLMATVHPDNRYSLYNLQSAGYECLLETEKYGGLRRKVLCKRL